MVFPLIPLFAKNLGASSSLVGAVVASFSLLSMFLAIPVGGLTDRWRTRSMLLLGVACNILYSGLLLVSHTVWTVVAAQVSGGLGFLLLIVASQAYISGFSDVRLKERSFGFVTLSAAAGQTIGPYLGGAILARADFVTVFGLATLLSTTGLVIAALPDQAQDRRGPSQERRTVQLGRLLADPHLLAVLGFTFCIVFAVSLRSSFLPLLLQEKGLPEDRIGLLISLFALSMTFIRIFIGRIMGAVTRKRLAALALGLACVGVGLVPLLETQLALGTVLVLFGLGFGISQPLSMMLVTDLAPGEHVGLAMGLRFTTITLATFFGPLLCGGVAEAFGLGGSFAAALLVVAAMGLILAAFARRLRW
jgi:MFS family permease